MLTFKQYLNEVLNKPYEWKLDAKKPGPDGENTDHDAQNTDHDGEQDAQNTDHDGEQYKFTTDSGLKYEVDMVNHGQGLGWELSFNIDVNNLRTLGKRVVDMFKLSGTGDQFRVFATVQDILKDFITRKKPNMIKFDASEPSRQRLYSTFTANFQRSQPELFNTYLAWSTSTGVNHYIMNREFAKEVLNGPTNSYFYRIIPSEYRDELRKYGVKK